MEFVWDSAADCDVAFCVCFFVLELFYCNVFIGISESFLKHYSCVIGLEKC